MSEEWRTWSWNAQCPGYGEDEACGIDADFRMLLLNDPRAFCERHALEAAAFWLNMGFSAPRFWVPSVDKIATVATQKPQAQAAE